MKSLKRDALLMKLGAAKSESPAAWKLVDLKLPGPRQSVTPETFTVGLLREKVREARRREGRYLLRSNLTNHDPAALWQFYLQLTQIEEAFKNLKGDLALRPIYHQRQDRIEAHIFVAFLAYCVHVTLRQRLRIKAPGLTPRAVLEKFATVQMLDAWFPTTDGRWLVFHRVTQPERDVHLMLVQLGLQLPPQTPPRITSDGHLVAPSLSPRKM